MAIFFYMRISTQEERGMQKFSRQETHVSAYLLHDMQTSLHIGSDRVVFYSNLDYGSFVSGQQVFPEGSDIRIKHRSCSPNKVYSSAESSFIRLTVAWYLRTCDEY